MSLDDIPDAHVRARLGSFLASSTRPVERGTVVWFLLGGSPALSLREAATIAESAFAGESGIGGGVETGSGDGAVAGTAGRAR
ncbi:hypothetical protein [Curtobacterium sp. RRHDQ10]|uniref:hypothetical protein n=1 Tax=Curtobacterium phyllosphaerae TaxID=3413379 RepID=UPI003BEF91D7